VVEGIAHVEAGDLALVGVDGNPVSYATSLMRQGVLISITEHLLSVFYSMGIDNVYVEIDNLEVPILDGSGLPFVRLIEQAGIRQYRRKRRYLRIRRPVSVEDKGKRISIIPDEVFRLTCDTDYPDPVVNSTAALISPTIVRMISTMASTGSPFSFRAAIRSRVNFNCKSTMRG
jgi:UDP-3-O-[3-hydroxymyristoyl] N-acetylglucosamine deacetylase